MSCGGVEINLSRGVIPSSGLGSPLPGSTRSHLHLCQSQFFPALPSRLHFTPGLHSQSQINSYLCSGILGIPAGSSGQGFGIADKVAESRNRSGFSMGGENQPTGVWN